MKKYKVVDAFSSKPFKGNPVAVFYDADGVDDDHMQAIARWINLSETTFLQKPTHPQADYKLRIFTPQGELPFAGHPTLGSAHAALETGLIKPKNGMVFQECGVGIVGIKVDRTTNRQCLTFELPPSKLADLNAGQVKQLENALQMQIDRAVVPAVVDIGAVWIVARMATAEQVISLKPDLQSCATFDQQFKATGIVVFGPHQNASSIEVRAFAPSCGVSEDPVCGSGNGAVAIFQLQRGLIDVGTSYTAFQGQCVGRDGRVKIDVDDMGRVFVGGECVSCLEGALINGI